MIFTSVSCFGSRVNQPEIGKEVEIELLEFTSSRLRFRVPPGEPLASWQAKLEGGIE
jgi:hypothetical protein